MNELEKDNRKYIKTLLRNSFSKKKDYDNQVWQRENYPELIESEKFYIQKVEYIHNNPVKKYYIEKPEHWIYSSARNRIVCDNSIIEIDSLTE